MPANNKTKSGAIVAGENAQVLESDYSVRVGVWIHVATANCEVIGTNDTAGVVVKVDEKQFFPCINLNKIQIKRSGGSDSDVTYFAF
jgi:hypothetical protein